MLIFMWKWDLGGLVEGRSSVQNFNVSLFVTQSKRMTSDLKWCIWVIGTFFVSFGAWQPLVADSQLSYSICMQKRIAFSVKKKNCNCNFITRHIRGVISSQHHLQHVSLFCFCGDTHPVIVALWHFHADLNFLSALQIFKDMPVSGGGQGNSQLNLPRRRSTDSKAPSCSERPLTLFHTPSFSEKDKGTPATSFFIKLEINVKLYIFLILKIFFY